MKTGGVRGKERKGKERRKQEREGGAKIRRKDPANNSHAYRTNAEANVPSETPPSEACGESEVGTSRSLGAASLNNFRQRT